jgi:hypothetical protein
MSKDSISELPSLIGDLFRTVDKLNRLFPDRPFTPDGHLVGSIGEVVAAYVYDLSLEKCSNQGFDARTSDAKRKVEVKLTGGRVISIASDLHSCPDVLLVLKLHRNTGFREIYNGPFPIELCSRLSPTKRKVVQVALSRLAKICPRDRTLAPCFGRSLDDLNQLFPNVAHTLP